MIGSIRDGLSQFWQRQDSSRRRLLVVLSITGLILVGFLVWMLNNTSYTVLYTNLTPKDAGEIMQQLEDMGISARAQGTDTIMVPEDQVDWLRMELAASGFPRSSTNLDILQLGSGFGMTEEDKAIYRRYQLQEDLQNAIKTFDNVQDARVSLIIPRESAFLIESQLIPATAAVLLTLRPGTELHTGHVQAISELVQKSVPNLKPEGVTIIDSNMRVLNADYGQDGRNGQDRQLLEQQVSERLKQQVMALLQPVFGPGNVLAEVSVTLDFNESVMESIRFEPADGLTTGMIASIEKIREVSSQNGGGAGEPGTGENGVAVPIYPVVETSDSVYEKNSERINYEINMIKEQLVRAQGDISHLSVSVILDSNQVSGSDYRDNVRQLVAAAVGVDQDHIAVDSLPFQATAGLDHAFDDYARIQERAMQWERTRFYILFGGGMVLVLIIFLTLVRLVRGKKTSRQENVQQLFPSLDPEQKAAAALAAAESESRPSETQLKVSEPSERAKIGEYIEGNPALVVSILRGWLAEDQG